MITRQFKFKTFDLINKKYISEEDFKETPYVFFNNPNFVVAQHVGFNDIHGEEIYEGDLVIQRSADGKYLGTGVIKWMWSGFWYHDNKTGSCLPPCSQNTNLEIIGNTYNG